MATQLTEYPQHWQVAVVTGNGKRKRMPRAPRFVMKGDEDLLRAALIAAALEARREFGIETPKEA